MTGFEQNNELAVYVNTGSGFREPPLMVKVGSATIGGLPSVLDRIEIDYRAEGSPSVSVSGTRRFRQRFADVDQDGLNDMLFIVDGDSVGRGRIETWVAFNLGAAFGDPVELPEVWTAGQRRFAAANREWRLDSDFTDVTGDGHADLVTWPDRSTMTVVARPGLSRSVDLLKTVDNGRGMRVSFSYAPSTDPDVVGRSGVDAARRSLPLVKQVVSEVNVEAGFGSPPMRTAYRYSNPRFVSKEIAAGVPGPARFAGFEETRTTRLSSDGEPAMVTAASVELDWPDSAADRR